MGSGNFLLNKNLKCIERYNPKLKEKLLNLPLSSNRIDFIETKLIEPNLSFNGIPLHSQEGAEIEAKTSFDGVRNTPKSRHIIFGIGIGHLFKESCKRSQGKVFLYEPNLEILRKAFELVDFSEELSKESVFVVSEIEVLKDLYNQNYIYNAESDFLVLKSYRSRLYANEIDEIIRRITTIVETSLMHIRGIIQRGLAPIEAVIKNLSYTLKAKPLIDLKDIYKGKTALVVSAGPSLENNIEIIKKNRDKIIIFCVGTAVKALVSKGVTPDFVNIIENLDCSGQLLGVDLSEINLISEPYSHNSLYLLNVKQNFLFPSRTYWGNHYWSNLTGIDISEYTVKGIVSYSALASAKMLGFSKLILVGQDLAYLNNQCYCSNSAYSDLVLAVNPETNKLELKVKDRRRFIKAFASANPKTSQRQVEVLADAVVRDTMNSLCLVKGINGEMLPTNKGYATFVEFFSEFAYNNNTLDLINTSMAGAQIDGFRNMPLEEALEGVATIEKIEIPKMLKYDTVKILKNLESDIEKLANSLNELGKADEYINHYEQELSSEKMFTVAACQYFDSLLDLYHKINNENFDFLLYKIISFNETIEISSKIEDMTDIDETKVRILYDLLKNYYTNVRVNIIKIMKEMNVQRKLINKNLKG